MTSAVADQRLRAAGFLEAGTSSKLQRERTARPEDAAGSAYWLAELRGRQIAGSAGLARVPDEHVGETRVVAGRRPQDVRHVEEVEDLGEAFEPNTSQLKHLREPEIERIECVVEPRIRRHEREQL